VRRGSRWRPKYLDAALNTDRLSGAEGTHIWENLDQRDRLMNAAESPTQMDANTSLQVWLFETLLRAFATGGATYADVLARVRRLLATGISPTELLDIVRRSQSIEPLPESAQGVLDLLNEAIRRDAGEAVVPADVQDADPQAVAPHVEAPHEEVMETSIDRQLAAHEAQIRSYERTREPEPAAAPRVTVPAADLAAAHAAVAAEQRRSRDLGMELAERNAVAEASRIRVEGILRDYERQKSEMHTLRNSLAARDTTIVQMQQSLDERDTRLAALQQEHTKVVSTLEAHAETGAQLEADLQAALARAGAISAESKVGQEAAAVLNAQLKRSESRLNTALTELGAVKTQSSAYLELIRTREWRRGFDHNMIRELDAQVGAANAGQHALESERDRLQSQLAAADSERARLSAELATRDRALLQAEERATSDAQRVAETKETAALRQAKQATQIAHLRTEQAAQIEQLRAENAANIERLQSEADQREEEIGVLMAQVQEARRPIQAFEAELKRLTEELAAADSERVRLTAELVTRDRALLQAEERASSDAQRAAESKETAGLRQAEQATQIERLQAEQATEIAQLRTEQAAKIEQLQAERVAQIVRLQAEADRREEEVGVLTAQVQKGRRPVQAFKADLKRLTEELAASDSEKARLTAELATRDRALLQANERASSDAQRVAETKEVADIRQAEQATQIERLQAEQATQITQLRTEQAAQIERWEAEQAAKIEQLRNKQAAKIERLQAEQATKIVRLQAEADQREEEVGVLMTRLQEARRPVQEFEAEFKRFTEELAAKDGVAAVFDEQNRKLAAILEWTRDALEECEFIIRRLERSESNNANVLGRIQMSVLERLKSVSGGAAAVGADPGAAASGAADRSAELIRVDGEQATTYVLAKRTRIGRATACELRIDSGSVSRHHALVIVGPCDTIIEDLNSTNGVLVNGRKVTRRVLSDGDALTIGDTRFRYFARSHDGPPGPNPADCAPSRHLSP